MIIKLTRSQKEQLARETEGALYAIVCQRQISLAGQVATTAVIYRPSAMARGQVKVSFELGRRGKIYGREVG